nr:MAG TPA: minor tail protein [Caudoviricetes sp.]
MSDGGIVFDTKIDTSEFKKGASELKAELKDLQSQLKTAENNSKSLYNAWEKGNFKDNKLKQALSEADGEASRLRNSIEDVKTRLASLPKTSLKDAMPQGEAPKFSLKGAIGNAGASLGKVANAISGGMLNATKALFGFNQEQGKTDSFANSLGKSIFSLGNMFKLLALRMAMRQVLSGITQGFGHAVEYSEALKTSMNGLEMSTGAFTNSLGAMIAPLVNAIAPVLSQIIDWFTAAANAVAHFFAVLTGAGSYIVAKKSIASVSSEQKKMAGAAKGATKALKEEQGALAGIDEINDISDKSNAGSGGGGGGGGGTAGLDTMFETVDTGALDGIWKMIADADWQGLGVTIGTKINEAFASIDWAGIGATAGKGIDGVIQTLYYTLKTIDFKAIGTDLATLLNNAIENIDFSILGRLLVRKTLAGIDFLIGFFTTLDYGDIAKAISDFLIGGYNEATEWLQSYDWTKLGESIVSAIVDFFSNLDAGGIASSAVTFLTTALLSALDLLGGIVGSVCDGIYNYFKGYIEDSDYGSVGANIIMGILKGILDALKNIATWLWENVCKPIIDAVKTHFGIHSPSTVFAELGEFLMQGMLNGIKKIWEDIKAWFDETFGDLKKFIAEAWTSISKNTSEMWGGIAKIFTDAWDNIKSVWDGVTGFFGGIWDGIKQVFGNVAQWFGDTFGGAWKAVKDVFSTGGTIFQGITEAIASTFRGIVNHIIGGINTVVSVPFNAINGALNGLRNISILGASPFAWLPSVSVPSIPYLANGAVIPANHEFLAVLGDQKSGTNIEAPLSTIQDAMRSVMDERSGNSDVVNMLATLIRVVQEKNLLIEDVGKAAVSYIIEETSRTGENPVAVLG